jgi:ketosteroid isomerase-like protein
MSDPDIERRLAAAEAKLRELADIQEIQALMYEYGYSFDDGRLDDFMNCFTEDGVGEYPPFDYGFRGRAEIPHFRDSVKDLFPRLTGTFHFTASPVITVNGDTAKARWHWMNPSTMETSTGEKVSAWQFGVYDTEYRREADGWKISLNRATYLAFFDLTKGYAGQPLIEIGSESKHLGVSR